MILDKILVLLPVRALEWVNELANVYADMEIGDINVSGNKIAFKAGFAGMEE